MPYSTDIKPILYMAPAENLLIDISKFIFLFHPTLGGTRRVILQLPDGNFMITEVDEEQFKALNMQG